MTQNGDVDEALFCIYKKKINKKKTKCKFYDKSVSFSSHSVEGALLCLPACGTNPTHLKHSIGGTGNERLNVQLLQTSYQSTHHLMSRSANENRVQEV